MDRRSFIVALFGGTAAASVLSVAGSHAASIVEPNVTAAAPAVSAPGLDQAGAEYARHMTWAGHGRRRGRRSMMRSRRAPMMKKNYKRTRRSRPMQQGS